MKHNYLKPRMRMYRIWYGMIYRCTNKKAGSFKRYGATGATVCSRWRKSFENFVTDMSKEYVTGLTLDRIDSTKPYSKENCRWATYPEQARNRKSNVLHTIGSDTMCLKDWCKKLKLPYKTINSRTNKYGWSIERALNTPVQYVKNP